MATLREGVLELVNALDRNGAPRRMVPVRELRELLAATEGTSDSAGGMEPPC